MKKFWLLMSFAAVLVLGACGGGGEGGEDESDQPADEGVTTEEESSEEGSEGSDSADAGDAELAKQTYEQSNCMSCHGEDLSGGSGPALTNVGSKLSEDEIRTKIEEGGGGMPAGLVTDEEQLDALVTWLSSQTAE
ncbi:c-type cytochrome [Salinicoccus halodurans]|uniref:Cytochrome c551 n=1 Tax=Salinicoccus halodurans TaxID=407035 RepID=A0A0F7D3W9_9STAP|nr:cytochrome c [Salinicoccus halodurans]AKG73215.1 hypothetical protein AAT16_02650 [Salinicoccus halodurans]SFK83879.1 cytochrome c551 [Salinicoccus halodurans]